MIPANVDHKAILADLRAWGWGDYKIDMACGFSKGYTAQLKTNIAQMTYQRAARLYNFWEDEYQRRSGKPIMPDKPPDVHLQIRHLQNQLITATTAS